MESSCHCLRCVHSSREVDRLGPVVPSVVKGGVVSLHSAAAAGRSADGGPASGCPTVTAAAAAAAAANPL